MNEEITYPDTLEETSTEIETEIESSTSEDNTVENETFTSDEQETIRALQTTIASLREQISELERSRDSQEKMLGQLTDFAALFPAVDIECIPESVWETVKKGTSLAAAYALYEKRVQAERSRIEKINSLNSSRSAGAAGKNTANEFFTPDDVRKMSRAEVHANFSKIKRSMEKWN